MNLADYPTPEADAIAKTCYSIPASENGLAFWVLLQSLEQRLGACRDALEGSQWLLTSSCDAWDEEATEQAEINRKALALTAPKP